MHYQRHETMLRQNILPGSEFYVTAMNSQKFAFQVGRAEKPRRIKETCHWALGAHPCGRPVRSSGKCDLHYQRHRSLVGKCLAESQVKYIEAMSRPARALGGTCVSTIEGEPCSAQARSGGLWVAANIFMPSRSGHLGEGEVCAPGYEPCLPDFGVDYDCRCGGGNGPRYTGQVSVKRDIDIYGLDGDGGGGHWYDGQ